MSLRSPYFAFIALNLATFCFAADQFAAREPRYHLRPGDVISVEYRYSPQFNATVSIEPDGFVSLPLLGETKLGGLTLTDVRSQLASKASERLNDPEITIALKEFEKPHYIVGGEVGAPGRFDIRGPITALRAIQIAGGFKSSAKANQVVLIRPVDEARGETKLIDLKRVTDKQALDEDIELRAGDMLIVPKTRIAKIEPLIKLINAGIYFNPLGF